MVRQSIISKIKELAVLTAILFIFLLTSALSSQKKENNKLDTIFVNKNVTTYLIFDDSNKIHFSNVGNAKDYATEIQYSTVLFKAKNKSVPTNFIVRFNNDYISGVLCFKDTIDNSIYLYKPIIKSDTTKEPIIDVEKIFIGQKDRYNYLGVSDNLMLVSVSNIYMDENFTYFKLNIENNSKIPYNIGNIRCYVQDRHTKKVLRYGAVRTNGNKRFFYTDLLSINKNEWIIVEINEYKGDRKFRILINYNDLQK